MATQLELDAAAAKKKLKPVVGAVARVAPIPLIASAVKAAASGLNNFTIAAQDYAQNEVPQAAEAKPFPAPVVDAASSLKNGFMDIVKGVANQNADKAAGVNMDGRSTGENMGKSVMKNPKTGTQELGEADFYALGKKLNAVEPSAPETLAERVRRTGSDVLTSEEMAARTGFRAPATVPSSAPYAAGQGGLAAQMAQASIESMPAVSAQVSAATVRKPAVQGLAETRSPGVSASGMNQIGAALGLGGPSFQQRSILNAARMGLRTDSAATAAGLAGTKAFADAKAQGVPFNPVNDFSQSSNANAKAREEAAGLLQGGIQNERAMAAQKVANEQATGLQNIISGSGERAAKYAAEQVLAGKMTEAEADKYVADQVRIAAADTASKNRDVGIAQATADETSARAGLALAGVKQKTAQQHKADSMKIAENDRAMSGYQKIIDTLTKPDKTGKVPVLGLRDQARLDNALKEIEQRRAENDSVINQA